MLAWARAPLHPLGPAKATALARFGPVIRTFLNPVAGMLHLPRGPGCAAPPPPPPAGRPRVGGPGGRPPAGGAPRPRVIPGAPAGRPALTVPRQLVGQQGR